VKVTLAWAKTTPFLFLQKVLV